MLFSMSTGHSQTWNFFQADHKSRISSFKSTSWLGLPTLHISARAVPLGSIVKACKCPPRNCTGPTRVPQAGDGPHWICWWYQQHCWNCSWRDGASQVQYREGEIGWTFGDQSVCGLHCQITGRFSQYSQSTDEGVWSLRQTELQWCYWPGSGWCHPTHKKWNANRRLSDGQREAEVHGNPCPVEDFDCINASCGLAWDSFQTDWTGLHCAKNLLCQRAPFTLPCWH